MSFKISAVNDKYSLISNLYNLQNLVFINEHMNDDCRYFSPELELRFALPAHLLCLYDYFIVF